MIRKSKKNKPFIDETKLASVVPGMLMSAKTLIEFDEEVTDPEIRASILGESLNR